MKKLRLSLAAMAIAVGAFGAFAFAPAKADDTVQTLHWFDAVSGNYIGPAAQDAQQTACGEPTVPCADGYTAVSGGAPAGVYVITLDGQEE